MLSFGVGIPATVPQRSEIPEGLMNYPVYIYIYIYIYNCNRNEYQGFLLGGKGSVRACNGITLPLYVMVA